MNKEMAKICNDVERMNFKNRVLNKKNAINKLEDLDSKELLIDPNDDDCKDIIEPLLHEFCKDATELVLCNDNSFKIKEKPKATKPQQEIIKPKVAKQETVQNREFEEECNENILRVEFKPVEQQDLEIREECAIEIQEVELCDYITSRMENGFDKHVTKLQKKKIMMAISPKSKDNEIEGFDNNDSEPQESHTFDQSTPNRITSMFDEELQISDLLNVTQIRADFNDKQKHIQIKYAEKWKIFVRNRKQYRAQQHQEALNRFFDKLAKKKLHSVTPESVNKTKLILTDYNRYQHRYKMQKHIIALQKAKLEEQQRIIEELKYNKIIEASKQSVDELKEEVRKKYWEIDRQLKPKIKCLTNELNIPLDVTEPLVLHCLKVPQFLQRMEKRAREREEKHAIIRERRRQMEEERMRLKQQEELAKAAMDKEQKIKKMKELKQKRKIEKVEAIRKKQYVERMRALTVMADIHYEKALMAKYGLRPFRLLIEMKTDNIDKAKAHYTFQLKKNIFLNWMWYTEDMWYERNFQAEDFWRKKMLRKCFDAFKKNYRGYVLKKQVAEDYYGLYVTQLVFRKFCEAIKILRNEDGMKLQRARQYFESNLVFKAFTCWRTLPALNALKREQDARKARWREKVLQVVPDYMPPED